VLFDFEKLATRDTQETVTTLARMARFVIADITYTAIDDATRIRALQIYPKRNQVAYLCW